MKILRSLLIASAVGLSGGLSSTSQSVAQTPASPEMLQAAKELVSLVSASLVSDMTTKITAQVWPPMESALRAQNSKLDAKTITELQSEFERLMVTTLSELMNDAPAIYARHFTVQEMRELVAFYRTSTGAKTLKVMPEVTAEFGAVMMPRLQGAGQKVNLAFLTIMQKRGYYAQ